jgi:D-alanyl-D-alanine dipeptidase/L,D-peptidoglycan transpeptidase YkuD (ErfK/YbiS/YcfS/YnhG family)
LSYKTFKIVLDSRAVFTDIMSCKFYRRKTMRRFLRFSLAVLVMSAATPCYAQKTSGHKQIVVSVTDSWSDFRASVHLFERKGGAWKRIGKKMEGVVGFRGLAWDPTAADRIHGEPVKAEGDLKAPAGLFPLPLSMGFSSRPPGGVTLPYRVIREGTHCVDDPASVYYNRIVDGNGKTGKVAGSWNSSERMWEMPEIYNLLLLVGYNTRKPKPGDGSCIFMHIRRPSGEPTYGCTALAKDDLAKVMKRLKPGKNPALAQLPRAVYNRVWRRWRLPSPARLDEGGEKRRVPLVDVLSTATQVKVEMRYAEDDNFTGKRVYSCGRCFLRPETATKVAMAQRELRKKGLSLKMWDCYRPPAAQRLFWSLVPDPRYVADPKTGSVHNRGSAVDVTLVDSEGKELEMPTGFDDFSTRAAHGETRLPAKAIENRRTLAEAMEKAGFKRLESEWWHYEDGEGKGGIIDVPFDDLCK